VYLSLLDLNIEREQIEQPPKPMIRFGTPVFDRSGRKNGILLFNYLGDKRFKEEVGQMQQRRIDNYQHGGDSKSEQYKQTQVQYGS
jgi:hypothetical protein